MAGQEGFAECVAQHLPFLNRIVRRLTRNDEMADDIVQQTILKALIHAEQFRFESTLKTWLTSIAMNEVRHVYRRKWRTAPLIIEDIDCSRYAVIESSNQIYQMKEREALIRRAVSLLPKSYRCVVELCDLQCLSLQEAATQLRLSLGAVKSRRQRARSKLRLSLAPGLEEMR
ncbi:MAG TPA: sigma-70 family RNA polymerase sigma factor [Bryobacteraceae bacterium]|nr:sigma-70 family RNA polymerase sigma factor [Bryobacteraceae bacterium]